MQTHKKSSGARRALHSFTAWAGPSVLDGEPIALLVTRGGYRANRKTGGMVQTYIIRTDKSPVEALQAGQDSSICGSCIHSSKANGGQGTCYVRVDTGVLTVFKAYKRGKYPALPLLQASCELDGAQVRMGTYGDPSAVPEWVWVRLLDGVAGCTGYTHGWKRPQAQYLKAYAMASCDTPHEAIEAQAQGWRTFTIVTKEAYATRHDIPPVTRSFLCPASEEAGRKLTCSECMACDGLRSGRAASVYIPVHGVAFKQVRFSTNLITIGRN